MKPSQFQSVTSDADAQVDGRPFTGGGKGRSSERILFVLSEKEWELFLPRFSRGDMEALGAAWIDTDALLPGDWLRILQEERPTVLVSAWGTPPLPEEWVDAPDLPLRYLCHITGSVRKVVSRKLIMRGVIVTNWGAIISHTIAEHAILLVLAMLRNMPAWRAGADADEESAFEKMRAIRTRSLRGKRVGLHGFGAIAREIVHMLRPFQVDIAAWSPNVPRALYEEFGVTPMPSLEALFSRSEVLIECEGLTPSTRGSVSEAVLRLLPEDAVFVNVGRPAVADEATLVRLAEEGRLRVGLDVFSPVAGSGNVRGALLSPHIAGPTWDTYPLCGDFAMENIEKYLAGETPEAIITLEVFDRST